MTSSSGSDKHKDKKLRGKTATMFQQDNNCQHSKHFRMIFDYLLDITPRKSEERHRDMQQHILKPIPKVERNLPEDKDGHRTILNQNGIDTTIQMLPLNVVKKHKQRGITNAETAGGTASSRTPMAQNRISSSPGAQRPIKTNFVQPPSQPSVGQPVGQQPKQEYQPSIAIANLPNRTNLQHPIRNQSNDQIQMTVGNKSIIQRKRTAEGKTVAPAQKVYFSTPRSVYTPTNAATIDGQVSKNIDIRKISTTNTGHRIAHVKTTGNSPRPPQIVTQQAPQRGTQIQVHNIGNAYQINKGSQVQNIPVNQLSPQGTIQFENSGTRIIQTTTGQNMIQINNGIQIQTTSQNQQQIKSEYNQHQSQSNPPPQIQSHSQSNTNSPSIQLVQKFIKSEHMNEDDNEVQNAIASSSGNINTTSVNTIDSVAGESTFPSTSSSQIVYVQGTSNTATSDGQKITLKPISGPGSRVIHIPQNGPGAGQYMTVVNSVGPKVVSQRGKQFVISNNSQSGSQGQQQIVLQSENQSGQQLVIPNSAAIGNLLPARGGLVFQNSNNQILQSGNKIFIQQSAQGPVILGNINNINNQLVTQTGQILQIQQGHSNKRMYLSNPNQRVMINQPVRNNRSQQQVVMQTNKQTNVVQLPQQQMSSVSHQVKKVVNQLGVQLQSSPVQNPSPGHSLPISENSISVPPTFERIGSLPSTPNSVPPSPQVNTPQPNWDQK